MLSYNMFFFVVGISILANLLQKFTIYHYILQKPLQYFLNQ